MLRKVLGPGLGSVAKKWYRCISRMNPKIRIDKRTITSLSWDPLMANSTLVESAVQGHSQKTNSPATRCSKQFHGLVKTGGCGERIERNSRTFIALIQLTGHGGELYMSHNNVLVQLFISFFVMGPSHVSLWGCQAPHKLGLLDAKCFPKKRIWTCFEHAMTRQQLK